MKINPTRTYLVLANILLVIFAIWFSNAGLLPFKNAGDFIFFAILSLIFAIYRPGWTFVFFIGALVLENVNLAPKNFGLALRPYQFFGAITIIALFVQFFTKRLPFSLPKFRWYDALPIIFALGGFLSAIFSANSGLGFKQSLIALSFVALYFLVRIYVQSLDDLKKIVPFFLSSAIIVLIYGIWQNVMFKFGADSFEIMPGRPNATFVEPDWLGIFLVFLLGVIFTIIYSRSQKSEISDFKEQAEKNLPNVVQHFSLLLFTLVLLVLTVSRSAWLGAVFVAIGFLKIMLTNGSLIISDWDSKKFLHALQFVAVALIGSLAIVYMFGLTRFQLFNRAASTGGLQKITVACDSNLWCEQQPVIRDLSDLESCHCRHINLEDIEKEKAAGYKIEEVYRPDPNVNIRSGIYKKSIEQIKNHPILGIGWGSIGKVLGTDERGASLNASNIFLEVWLGAGFVGYLAFLIWLGYIFVRGAMEFLNRRNADKTIPAFIMLGWVAIVIPNLFNSGIFLGFVWVYLAVAVSLIESLQNRTSQR